MEQLANDLPSTQDAAALEAHWKQYLEKLQKEDPDEYKLLLEELQNLKPNAGNPDIAVSSHGEQDEDNVEGFSPVLPGGKQKLGKQGVTENHESQEVLPLPGFVLKTKTEKGMKVFINICQSALLQEMGPKKTLLEDGTEQEGMNIPLSLGPPRNDKDNKGAECLVYDIIVHPKVVKESVADESGQFRSFLCELALQYVEQKYKTKLDPRYKLPKLKYKGDAKNPPLQYIRKEKKPKIEELSGTEKSVPVPRKLEPMTPQLSREHSRYTLVRKFSRSDDVPCDPAFKDPTEQPNQEELGSSFELRIHVPEYKPEVDPVSSTSADGVLDWIELSVSHQFAQVKFGSLYHPIELFLPSPVFPSETIASYSANDKHISVVLPIDQKMALTSEDLGTGPDLGSRPWLLATALEGSAAMKMESKPLGPEVEVAEQTNEIADDLPEDRFHRSDMMSQHIKDERERQQQQKQKESEEKERKEAEEKKQKEMEEVKARREKAIETARLELEKNKVCESGTGNEVFELEEDGLELL